ncbi:MAG: hypothetical protein U5K53_08665 [Halanaerobiales bacterium]|nr:hypothetical protein [Halanaerobiales bacterium]
MTRGILLHYQRPEEIDERIEQAEIDMLDYDRKRDRYRLQLFEEDLENHKELLIDIFEQAYEN